MSTTDVNEPGGTPYHISQQYAAGLLPPLLAELRTIERRAATYLEHLRMTEADREALRQAHEVLLQAAAQVAELVSGTVSESTELPRSAAGSPRSPATRR